MATRTLVCPDCEAPLAPGRFSCASCGALVASVASSARPLLPTDFAASPRLEGVPAADEPVDSRTAPTNGSHGSKRKPPPAGAAPAPPVAAAAPAARVEVPAAEAADSVPRPSSRRRTRRTETGPMWTPAPATEGLATEAPATEPNGPARTASAKAPAGAVAPEHVAPARASAPAEPQWPPTPAWPPAAVQPAEPTWPTAPPAWRVEPAWPSAPGAAPVATAPT